MYKESSVEEIFEKYGEMLYKICIVMLKRTHDAEDTVQDIIIKYMTHNPAFISSEHEKAWMIRVAMNLCKDKLRFYKIYPQINIETIATTYPEQSEDNQILEALLALQPKYKEVLLLHYVEGYKSKREKTLEDLAEKVAKTVIRTRKPIKLEPMQAYERKIIHSKLQKNDKVETNSIGEEPYRRIVVSLKK